MKNKKINKINKLIHRGLTESLQNVYLDTKKRNTLGCAIMHIGDLFDIYNVKVKKNNKYEITKNISRQIQNSFMEYISKEDMKKALDIDWIMLFIFTPFSVLSILKNIIDKLGRTHEL